VRVADHGVRLIAACYSVSPDPTTSNIDLSKAVAIVALSASYLEG
jgi:hypothetical protein